MTLDRFFFVSEMANEMEDGGHFELLPYKKNVSFRYEKLKLVTENDIKDNDDDSYDGDKIFNIWDNNFDIRKSTYNRQSENTLQKRLQMLTFQTDIRQYKRDN